MGRPSTRSTPQTATGSLASAFRPTMSPLFPVHVTTSIVVCVESLFPLVCFLWRLGGKDHRANPCRGSPELRGGSGSGRTLARRPALATVSACRRDRVYSRSASHGSGCRVSRCSWRGGSASAEAPSASARRDFSAIAATPSRCPAWSSEARRLRESRFRPPPSRAGRPAGAAPLPLKTSRKSTGRPSDR